VNTPTPITADATAHTIAMAVPLPVVARVMVAAVLADILDPENGGDARLLHQLEETVEANQVTRRRAAS
jgi:hypothetical protein